MDPSNSQHQHQHQQGMATHTPTFEDVLNCPSAKELQERQKRSLMNRPQPEALKCPRCDSSNTKFCYYNNYSLTQPRYFCKACRRYWTKGGSLRNVPVGGGCRKNNKRISSCSSSSATSKAKSSPSSSISSHHHLHHHHQDNNNNQIYLNTTNSIINPLLTFPSSLSYDTNDLTLAFGRLHKQQPTTASQLGFDHGHHQTSYGNTNSIIGNLINSSSNSNNTADPGFIDALRSGFLDPSSGFHSFYSSYGNGISMGDHHHQHQQQQQVESNNNNNNNNNGGGSIINGNCHEEDDDQHHRDEQVVLPNYDQVEMGLTSTTSSTITTATKQELLKDNETKILWNFPWHGQFGGEQANHHHHHNNSIHNNIMGNVIDSSSGVRDWNGLNGWHGLVNSPLM